MSATSLTISPSRDEAPWVGRGKKKKKCSFSGRPNLCILFEPISTSSASASARSHQWGRPPSGERKEKGRKDCAGGPFPRVITRDGYGACGSSSMGRKGGGREKGEGNRSGGWRQQPTMPIVSAFVVAQRFFPHLQKGKGKERKKPSPGRVDGASTPASVSGRLIRRRPPSGVGERGKEEKKKKKGPSTARGVTDHAASSAWGCRPLAVFWLQRTGTGERRKKKRKKKTSLPYGRPGVGSMPSASTTRS